MIWVAILSILVALSASFTIWSRKETRIRLFGFLLLLLAVPLGFMTVFSSLGYAAPYVPGINIPEGKWNVVKAYPRVYEAIYVLVDLPGEPKLYKLPWNENTLKQLEKLLGPDLDRDQEDPGALLHVPSYDDSWDENEPQFLPPPQPRSMPGKEDAVEIPFYDRGD